MCRLQAEHAPLQGWLLTATAAAAVTGATAAAATFGVFPSGCALSSCRQDTNRACVPLQQPDCLRCTTGLETGCKRVCMLRRARAVATHHCCHPAAASMPTRTFGMHSYSCDSSPGEGQRHDYNFAPCHRSCKKHCCAWRCRKHSKVLCSLRSRHACSHDRRSGAAWQAAATDLNAACRLALATASAESLNASQASRAGHTIICTPLTDLLGKDHALTPREASGLDAARPWLVKRCVTPAAKRPSRRTAASSVHQYL